MSTTAERPVLQPSCPCLNLASARQRIGITLEQIAQTTRIAPHARLMPPERVSKGAARPGTPRGAHHAHRASQTSAMTITANIKFIDELLSFPEAPTRRAPPAK